ncbi:universal stress protein [Halovivax sp.]|uniref:universal stress protein n=1 Tax=Halovivax sp. TaxID=1935978 RepID=UPI0025C11D9C|nr:universal stress protein [Halovivax sp.]
MSDPQTHRVLVPVDVRDGEELSPAIVDAFASISIVLLGYVSIPDQTGPEQARDRFGDAAREELERHRGAFADAGADVTTRLAFTRDRFETFERAAVELECEAVLVVADAPRLDRFLVAVRGDVATDRIAGLLAAILAETEIRLTLFSAVAEGDRAEREALLSELAASVEAGGVGPERIDRELVEDDSPTDAIVEAAADHDLVVAGESRPSIRRLIFRDRTRRIARRTAVPTLVVRGQYLEPAGEGSESTREG